MATKIVTNVRWVNYILYRGVRTKGVDEKPTLAFIPEGEKPEWGKGKVKDVTSVIVPFLTFETAADVSALQPIMPNLLSVLQKKWASHFQSMIHGDNQEKLQSYDQATVIALLTGAAKFERQVEAMSDAELDALAAAIETRRKQQKGVAAASLLDASAQEGA